MRRAKPERREILPDIRYNNVTIQTMIHHMLHRGKKSTATNVMYDSLEIIRERNGGKDPVEVFDAALKNVAPAMEVRPRRVGGATYQVPMQVNSKRQLSLAIRWIREASRAVKGKAMAECLANELMAAYRGEGAAMTTRENVHRMAEANKAFAHFAW